MSASSGVLDAGAKMYPGTMNARDLTLALLRARYGEELIVLAPFKVVLNEVRCKACGEMGALEIFFEDSHCVSRDQPWVWTFKGRVCTRAEVFTAHGIGQGAIIEGTFTVGEDTVEFSFTVTHGPG